MAKGLRQLRELQNTWDAVDAATSTPDRLRTGGDPSREIRALPDAPETAPEPEEEDPWAIFSRLPDASAGGIWDGNRLLGVYKVHGKHLHVANPQGAPLGSCTISPGENPPAVAKQVFKEKL